MSSSGASKDVKENCCAGKTGRFCSDCGSELKEKRVASADDFAAALQTEFKGVSGLIFSDIAGETKKVLSNADKKTWVPAAFSCCHTRSDRKEWELLALPCASCVRHGPNNDLNIKFIEKWGRAVWDKWYGGRLGKFVLAEVPHTMCNSDRITMKELLTQIVECGLTKPSCGLTKVEMHVTPMGSLMSSDAQDRGETILKFRRITHGEASATLRAAGQDTKQLEHEHGIDAAFRSILHRLGTVLFYSQKRNEFYSEEQLKAKLARFEKILTLDYEKQCMRHKVWDVSVHILSEEYETLYEFANMHEKAESLEVLGFKKGETADSRLQLILSCSLMPDK